ncbi:hypothetical protein GK047_11925 [Paenibacillus sp. SYP-B3998]|uniref:Condensation domain-containing protein n=1 Tax=Paenibacillus sp. SYP-B3998 TaxID=2678564 RepID=A0A6G3ZX60_9BACL|nr:condensation domain-containing protein [Paenibacillus sp. SYP-B3998]NEW06722.1 hypothetical protein [Paenibacillus sp. SYP-B3998]
MTLEVTETGSHLECVMEYRTALFKRETIAQLAKDWGSVLQAFAHAPNQFIKQVQLETTVNLENKPNLKIEFTL